MWCKQPDRDAPKMRCGYPLPCPWHTVVVDTTTSPATITEPVTAHLTSMARERLKSLAATIQPDAPPPAAAWRSGGPRGKARKKRRR